MVTRQRPAGWGPRTPWPDAGRWACYTARARARYLVNHVEMLLVVLIVFVASFMARGIGMR